MLRARCNVCKKAGGNMRHCPNCEKVYCLVCVKAGLWNVKLVSLSRCPFCGFAPVSVAGGRLGENL